MRRPLKNGVLLSNIPAGTYVCSDGHDFLTETDYVATLWFILSFLVGPEVP